MWSRGKVSRSNTATSRPGAYFFRMVAQVLPEGPPPIMTTSHFVIGAIFSCDQRKPSGLYTGPGGGGLVRVSWIKPATIGGRRLRALSRLTGHAHTLGLSHVCQIFARHVVHLPWFGEACRNIGRTGSASRQEDRNDDDRDSRNSFDVHSHEVLGSEGPQTRTGPWSLHGSLLPDVALARHAARHAADVDLAEPLIHTAVVGCVVLCRDELGDGHGLRVTVAEGCI